MVNYLDELNPSQRIAATTLDGPLLILAGAGSGKTKTITTRLAYLLEQGIDPGSTLTLTFTNKAASEMRERAMKLISHTLYPPLLATFHRFGMMFLKFHIHELSRSHNFVIVDSDDKKRLIRQISKEFPEGQIATKISHFKNSFQSLEELQKQANNLSGVFRKDYESMIKIYTTYQETLEKLNLVDFDDLLTLPCHILQNNPSLCDDVSRKYQFITVDEYQDTNDIQNRLLHLLCKTHDNLCVVGDDDQSIYGWRGADVGNILRFNQIFPHATVIKLEHNYRSSPEILQIANAIISYNKERHEKKLIPTRDKGKNVQLKTFSYEGDESDFVATEVKKLLLNGVNADDIAVLYRINALSRSLEESFSRARVAFKIVGGMRFYERSEIKDVISYFRLFVNPHDDFSFLRVANRPKRGVGESSLEKLQLYAKEHHLSLFDTIKLLENTTHALLPKKAMQSLSEFIHTIEELHTIALESLIRLIDNFETYVGLRTTYASLPEEADRALNIDEFYGLIRDFSKNNPESTLEDFLNTLSLESDQDTIEEAKVSLMSIHAAKGLEFNHLFVVGWEEGFFPLVSDENNMEEERRLAYVAITRAKKELTLTTTKSRLFRGKRTDLTPSRFLGEAELLSIHVPAIIPSSTSNNPYAIGQCVKHKLFGFGKILGATPMGGGIYKLAINFSGTKREILSNFVETIA